MGTPGAFENSGGRRAGLRLRGEARSGPAGGSGGYSGGGDHGSGDGYGERRRTTEKVVSDFFSLFKATASYCDTQSPGGLTGRVHSHLKYLVDNHASVWACASFQELWPSPGNLKLFERAAEKGNFEAAVKLGIAYLYNEGLSVSDEARAEVNGLKASRYFSLAERLNVGAAPFIWLFIRPPWSVSGSCCKAVVHESLRAECQLQKTHRASILHCLGRVLSLFELSLAKACAHGHQLGLEAKASSEIVCQLFQASHAVNKQRVFSVQKGLNDTMRYILIDWLVEVATMKDFSSLCLHLTVECVDRYLRRRLVPRYRLQLLGIACMVICTRNCVPLAPEGNMEMREAADEEKQKQARNLFEESANQGCLTSSYLLWESDRRMDMLDPGRCLHSFRKLRDFAAKGCWEAQLSLAKACAHGHQLGLEAKASSEIVCQLFQASHAVNKQRVFSVQKGLNDTMR
ncbi:CCNF [Cervus elaphus hippelaphus]|uniref:CCNF n=1 Tax=Cervus elaphus hippelaphus TaxID=46360 RepID=A0A212CZL1_CEREH|nr:CCNF [Cervus elaphus hippelaphus]